MNNDHTKEARWYYGELEEKNKEIDRLNNNWEELKDIIKEQIRNPLNIEMKIFSKMILNDMETLERLKEGK